MKDTFVVHSFFQIPMRQVCFGIVKADSVTQFYTSETPKLKMANLCSQSSSVAWDGHC